MTCSVENLKEFIPKNTLELINQFSKVVGCKNDMRIPILFLYKPKMKLSVLLTVAPKTTQFLSIIKKKEKPRLVCQKQLLKYEQWENILCPWIRKPNIKMATILT